MAVTIYDIASKAGCSPSTVSLVINDSKKISDATKSHVRKIAEELGYYPNYAARSLKNSQTYTIGVIAPNLKNPLFCMMISGISDSANKYGYNIVLGLSEQSIEIERNNIRMLSERKVDGLVIFPSFLEEIFPDFISGVDEKNMPMVEVDGEMYYFKKVGEQIERARFIRLVDEEKELEKNKWKKVSCFIKLNAHSIYINSVSI